MFLELCYLVFTVKSQREVKQKKSVQAYVSSLRGFASSSLVIY
jgi:hypothetical protein